MAFATVDDLQKRWRDLTPEEFYRAETLLEDASVYLISEFRRAKKEIQELDGVQMSALKMVTCSLAKRIMGRTVDGDYSQMSQTSGVFTEQFTFSNPSGDMYLTANERNLLGLPKIGQRIGCVDMVGGSDAR